MAPRLPARTGTDRCRSGACRTMRAATAVAQRVGGAGCAGPAPEGSDYADAAWRGAAPVLGRGHGSETDAMCRHPPRSIGNRDVTLPDGCDGWSSQASRSRFFVRPRYRFFVPIWLWWGTARGKGKAGRWRPPRPPSRRGCRTIDRSAASPSSRRQLPSQHPVGLAELSAVGLAPACWRRDRRCVLR
jgi:hypothetical protein